MLSMLIHILPGESCECFAGAPASAQITMLGLPCSICRQGILTACFHVLSCMTAEVIVFTQRELCLCRNCQSVLHVGLLLMLLSKLSQLPVLCREEPCQLERHCVWRI